MKLIAEFCQNHLGDFGNVVKMIAAAKESGATHAKIQSIYVEELTFRREFEDINSTKYRPYDREFARLAHLELTQQEEVEFVKLCLSNGLVPMTTVFTHTGAERARRSGFKSIKIASYDCASWPLIKRCLTYADELVISTGATSWEEVTKTARLIRSTAKVNQTISLLHARTLYPCEISEAGLARMWALQSFGFEVGLSDHSSPSLDSLLTSKIAIAMGCEILERHFTVFSPDATKDGPVSVNPDQLKELSDFSKLPKIRLENFFSDKFTLWNEALKISSLEPSQKELDNATYYRGRFSSTVNGKRVFPWEELSINL